MTIADSTKKRRYPVLLKHLGVALLAAFGPVACSPTANKSQASSLGSASTGSFALFFDRMVLRPGFTDLKLVAVSVDLFYLANGPPPPFGGHEFRCVAPNKTTVNHGPVALDIPLDRTGRIYVAGFDEAPVGAVTEIRMVLSSLKGTYNGRAAEVRAEVECDDRHREGRELQVVRLVPHDGVPFQIVANSSTRIAVEFDALIDLTRDHDGEKGDRQQGGDHKDASRDKDKPDHQGGDRDGDAKVHEVGDEKDGDRDNDDGDDTEFVLSSTLRATVAPNIGQVAQVGSGFKPGPADDTLTFGFKVSPAPPTLPIVRWLGVTANAGTRSLVVVNESPDRYSAVLNPVPPLADGQLVIELSYPGMGRLELHFADFALRQHVTNSPTSRPSRSGHFQVFTRPEGVSPVLRLLIASSEQPIEDLPPGVTSSAVAGVYSVDFLTASSPVNGWQLTLADIAANPALFYLPNGSAVWQALSSRPIDGHPLLNANFPGPGTYLLARKVTP